MRIMFPTSFRLWKAISETEIRKLRFIIYQGCSESCFDCVWCLSSKPLPTQKKKKCNSSWEPHGPCWDHWEDGNMIQTYKTLWHESSGPGQTGRERLRDGDRFHETYSRTYKTSSVRKLRQHLWWASKLRVKIRKKLLTVNASAHPAPSDTHRTRLPALFHINTSWHPIS